MAAKSKYLIYRGNIRALQGHKGSVIFTTVHPEGQATGVYVVDLESGKPVKADLPGGGVALVRDEARFYVADTGGGVFAAPLSGKGIAQIGAQVFDPAPVALALVSKDQLAVASGRQVAIMGRADGQVVQTLELPERATCMVADASGEWLVVGTDRGVLCVFEREDKAEFASSAQSRLHEGAISSLMLDPDELRVYSTGPDLKLLVTHVRGALEPEDRGSGGSHDKAITAMLHGRDGRFYTTAPDSTIKAWPAGRGKQRPITYKDDVAKPVDLCLVELDNKPHLGMACWDGTLRFFPIIDEGKLGPIALIMRGAFEWAQNEFTTGDPARREAALKKLASFNDSKSLKMISQQAHNESDHKLQVLATELLADSGNKQAIKLLEALLTITKEDVRIAALGGLRKLEGMDSLRPLELALAAQKADVGKLAVEALAQLARTDDKALELLIGALNREPSSVRLLALSKLEAHWPKDSPEALLTAIRSTQMDVRRVAIIRVHQRNMLGESRVEAALRRLWEDANADVRLTSFLVSLLRQPRLAQALRSRDEVLHRQLFEIETFGQAREKDEDRQPPKIKQTKLDELKGEDWQPLLEAMASRMLDTCMRGALGLSQLQDPRAFGTLLQLSRENDQEARVTACRSFEALADPRSVRRLRMMLRDGSPAVRDAAFTALAKIEAEHPLEAAQAGLSADHEDVRRRGLQVLVSTLRDTKAGASQEAALGLLRLALNDRVQPVRAEAFKSVLALKVGGSPESALRFATSSMHADVRMDILVELMAQFQEDWAWAMVLETFDDPEAMLRRDAFDFALKKAKRERRKQTLEASLKSRYADVRLMSVKELTERKLDEVEDLIVQALNDDDREVRQTAISALVTADATQLLVKAMDARHDDVRVRASVAVAGMGNAAAMEPLLALALAPEPELKDQQAKWLDHAVRALDGLAELGEPGALERIKPLVERKDAKLRQAAVRALVWTSRRETLDTLREVVRHADDAVKKEAALGLAYYGDSTGASILFGGKGVSADETLLASLGLMEQAEDAFLTVLDHSDASLRRRALLILLLLELSESDGIPDKSLAALSAAHPEVRLWAAQALEAFSVKEGFEPFVIKMFNSLGSPKVEWAVSRDIVLHLSRALTMGAPQVRVRAARLLEALFEDSKDGFERRWAIYARRYQGELARLEREAAAAAAVPLSGRLAQAWSTIKTMVKGADKAASFDQALRALVFGAYVGLSRQPGDERIRNESLARLVAMVKETPALSVDAQRVLILALGDGAQSVRQGAFDALVALGLDTTALTNEALSTTWTDMGSRALGLLAERGGAGAGEALLKDVLLTKTGGLEEEAAKLLADAVGWTKVYVWALGAQAEGLRARALQALIKAYETDAVAAEGLRNALKSRFEDVRFGAASALAVKLVADAYDVLLEMVLTDNQQRQRQGIQGLRTLGRASAAGLLLDRVDNDPGKTAVGDDLIQAAASFRDRAIEDRLFAYLDRDRFRWSSFNGLLTISGHDQYIQDPNEEQANNDWEKPQHPRHDDILAGLLDVAYRLADSSMLTTLVPKARWARTNAADRELGALAGFSRPEVQLPAIEAIGWRMRKRGGSDAIILKTLQSGAPEGQFLAAEALALAGRKDGFTVLMTAVSYMDNFDYRRRAVLALGELADPQSLDQLLELAQDEVSPLRGAAAEALGRMAKSPKADEILRVLTKLVQDDTSVAGNGLIGLRYFNTSEAWRVIHDYAANTRNNWWARKQALEQLGERRDASNISMFMKVLQGREYWDLSNAAANSLRKMFDADSLEPDYLLVQASVSGLQAQEKTLERLREQGDAAQILAVLPKIQAGMEEVFLKPLVAALLARVPMPVTEVAPLLDTSEDRTVTVAAQIVGRAGKEVAAKHGAVLERGLDRTHGEWLEVWGQVKAQRSGAAQRLPHITERYRLLAWAAGRLEVGLSGLERALAELPMDVATRSVREEALLSMAGTWSGKRGISAIEAAARGLDPVLRPVAAAALAALAPASAAALAQAALEDAPSFRRLVPAGQLATGSVATLLKEAAASAHHQGVALPHLVASRDVAGLSAIALNEKVSDEARLGALEALALLGGAQAEGVLAAVGKDEEQDEELRQAAWRALRRSRRLASKRQPGAEV
jgi:ParB family transcriptional regulator, chromosome partitioning protein